jgi:hypothetical protein
MVDKVFDIASGTIVGLGIVQLASGMEERTLALLELFLTKAYSGFAVGVRIIDSAAVALLSRCRD